jgi:hypothetical protein
VNAEPQVDSYLSDLRANLISVTIAEREEIVREIRDMARRRGTLQVVGNYALGRQRSCHAWLVVYPGGAGGRQPDPSIHYVGDQNFFAFLAALAVKPLTALGVPVRCSAIRKSSRR